MNRFKSLRQSRSLTQQQIADYLGLSRAAYTNIENEKRQPDTEIIFSLSDYYNVTIDYLLGRSDTSAPKAAALPQASALSPEEQRLLDAFRALNADGRLTAQTMLSSLAANPALTKDTSSEQMA